jgi:hypothetical protein
MRKLKIVRKQLNIRYGIENEGISGAFVIR